MILFEEEIKENREAFVKKVFDIWNKLLIPEPDHLMFTMHFETGAVRTGIIDHRIVNFQKGDDPDPAVRCEHRATGLIQFMPFTSKELGITNTELREMTNVQQLDYVEKYLKRFKGKFKSFVDVYLSVFYPIAVGRGDDYTITRDIIAMQNSIFDRNKDLDITVLEIKNTLLEQIPTRYKHLFY